MLPELSEVKARRQQLSLTQEGLAGLSGVSQSLIAKIESGRIIPSYEKAKRIFRALDRFTEERALTAEDVMAPRLFSVKESDSVKKAIDTMEAEGVSQLPVMKGSSTVGSVSEGLLLGSLEKLENVSARDLKVREVMSEPLPIVQHKTPLKAVSALLNYSSGVLVQKGPKIAGIITKSDLLHTAARSRPEPKHKP